MECTGSRPGAQRTTVDADRVLLDGTRSMVRGRAGSVADLPSFEPAGPRRKIFFDFMGFPRDDQRCRRSGPSTWFNLRTGG